MTEMVQLITNQDQKAASQQLEHLQTRFEPRAGQMGRGLETVENNRSAHNLTECFVLFAT